MIKLMVLLRRKPGMGAEEFHRYWRDVHGPLVMNIPEFMRHIRRYVQSHSLDSAGLDFPAGATAYDGAAELWFDSIEAMNAAFHEPRYLEIVRDDEQKFLDLPNCAVMVVEEVPKYSAEAMSRSG